MTIIGIHLGWAHTYMALWHNGLPVVICNVEGDRATPTGLENFQANWQDWPTRLAPLFRKLFEDASTYLGESVQAAVVAVPDAFSNEQRQAVFAAGELARCNVLRVVGESQASAIAAGLHQQNSETILALSLSPKTLQATVLEVAEGLFERLATETIVLEPPHFEPDGLQLCESRIQRVIQQALGEAPIDHVVLMGSAVPPALLHWQQFSGRQRYASEEVGAIGAAIQASLLSLEDQSRFELVTYDYTSLTFGIATAEGLMAPIIPCGTSIPCRQSLLCTLSTDHQTSLQIPILRGERLLAKDNQQFSVLHLQDISAAPRGTARIEVTFEIDPNGILTVTAQDLATRQQAKQVIPEATVTEAEAVRRIRAEAERHAECDRKLFEPIQARETATQLIEEVHQQLGELVKQVSTTDRAWLDPVVQQLHIALEQRPALSAGLPKRVSPPLLTASQSGSIRGYALPGRIVPLLAGSSAANPPSAPLTD